MFNGVTLYYQFYDHTLIGWASLPSVQNWVTFHAGDSYIGSPEASAAYMTLTYTYSWTITHGGFLVPNPPDLSNPGLVEYIEGETGNEIVWDVGDKNPDYYNITEDGVLIDEGYWTNGTITVDVDGNTVGYYEYEITVFDDYGNFATDLVIVDVDTIVTVTETNTETETDTEAGVNSTVTETSVVTEVNGTATDTITEIESIISTLTEMFTITDFNSTAVSDLTDTTDAPIFFTLVIMGLAVFVLRRRQNTT